jgi:hypothetical protein
MDVSVSVASIDMEPRVWLILTTSRLGSVRDTQVTGVEIHDIPAVL